MARLKAVNDAISELAVALATADNHMHLKVGGGVAQGFPTAGDYMCRIGTGEDFEIVRGTLRPSTTHPADTDTVNITRAQDGTTARVVSWPIGTPVWIGTTKSYLEELQAEIDLKAGIGQTATPLITWVIATPAVGGVLGPRLHQALTCHRLDAHCKDATSVTFNIEERSTIGAAGTDILAADMVADANGETGASFSNAGLAADCWLYLDISAVSGNPAQLTVSLACTVT